jgi:hypothetical protein
MDNKDFTEKIYGPYNAAWKIIKLLQYCGAHSGNWDLWYKELRRYEKEYLDGNKFAFDLGKFIMQAAEDIRDMNEGRVYEAQSTNEEK